MVDLPSVLNNTFHKCDISLIIRMTFCVKGYFLESRLKPPMDGRGGKKGKEEVLQVEV